MSRPKPDVTKAPFEQSGSSANTYGYMSPSRDDPNVAAYLNAPLDVDPGVGRRADLAEQGLENRWNSAFAQGIPEHMRMQQVVSGQRLLRSETATQEQQAKHAKDLANLGRLERFLPQLVQTGGATSSQGFNTQITQAAPSPWASFLGSAVGAAASPYI